MKTKAEPITVVFWKWKAKNYRTSFSAESVNIARDMVRRNCTMPLEFVCITDDGEGLDPAIRVIPLWENPAPTYGEFGRPNCTVRLKAFSPEMADLLGKRFIWFDLDMVVTGNIDHIIGAPERFAMWGDTAYKFQYNGSLCLMDAGIFPHVWADFKGIESLQMARAAGFIGSDQSWISMKVGVGERMFGKADGVYSFKNHYKADNIRKLIDGCCIVFFHGQYDPWHANIQAEYPWVKDHYRIKEAMPCPEPENLISA